MLKKVLVIGSVDEDLRRINDQLRDESDLRTATLRWIDGAAISLQEAIEGVDLVIVCDGGQQLGPLDALSGVRDPRRLPIIVCGETTSREITRLMVRLGVADLLPSTPSSEDLRAAVRRALRATEQSADEKREAFCISVLGASGGVGTSFLAANLAHVAAMDHARSVALFDLDMTFAPIVSMLGLNGGRSIVDALGQSSELDALALSGYALHHDSGLDVFAAIPVGVPPRIPDPAEWAALLRLARQRYDVVFIAVNRWLDAASIQSLSDSQRIVVVTRQTLADIRSAVRLRGLLSEWVGVPTSNLRVTINRYSPRAAIREKEVMNALHVPSPPTIPEDLQLVRHSVDSGIPIAKIRRNAPITEALYELNATLLGPTPVVERRRPMERIFSVFTRG